MTGSVSCAFDKQTIRQDDQEKVYLKSLQKYIGMVFGGEFLQNLQYTTKIHWYVVRWERNPAVPYSSHKFHTPMKYEYSGFPGNFTY